jgi:hypothetical protein
MPNPFPRFKTGLSFAVILCLLNDDSVWEFRVSIDEIPGHLDDNYPIVAIGQAQVLRQRLDRFGVRFPVLSSATGVQSLDLPLVQLSLKKTFLSSARKRKVVTFLFDNEFTPRNINV